MVNLAKELPNRFSLFFQIFIIFSSFDVVRNSLNFSKFITNVEKKHRNTRVFSLPLANITVCISKIIDELEYQPQPAYSNYDNCLNFPIGCLKCVFY